MQEKPLGWAFSIKKAGQSLSISTVRKRQQTNEELETFLWIIQDKKWHGKVKKNFMGQDTND